MAEPARARGRGTGQVDGVASAPGLGVDNTVHDKQRLKKKWILCIFVDLFVELAGGGANSAEVGHGGRGGKKRDTICLVQLERDQLHSPHIYIYLPTQYQQNPDRE